MTAGKKKKSGWGIGIALLYGSFAVFMLSIVAYVSLVDFHLVDRDYYEKGVNYQQQIDRLNRTSALDEKPAISILRDDQLIKITFPNDLVADDLVGQIKLYNPANAKEDITLPISLDSSNTQWIPFTTLTEGNWKLKIDWSVRQTSYFIESYIYLNDGTE